ncbi:MAG TPA: tetratricopeptide repeat protein [Gemmatimonadales bacterium]|nr:tetratricopeptide repeat protein [Gemmatimonadales bacterium]
MNRSSWSVGSALLAAAIVMVAPGAPAVAQIALRSERAAAAMPDRYSEPLCPLKGKHYRTTDAQLHLREALAATEPDKRARALEEGRQSLLEGIAKDKQEKSSTAWYTLAQIYLYQGDLVGADSALRRTQAVSPQCAESVEALRTSLWVPLINAAAKFTQSGASDSALALFQQAAAIFPEKPQGMLNVGVIFANRGETDSAITWFERAAAAAARGDVTEERNQATYNLAAMLQRAERHAEAAAALEQYLSWMPGDENAKRALAVSYRATGRSEEARALERRVGASDDATPDDAMRIAVNLYEEKKYAEAVEAFERVRATSPYSRDVILGLAACYQALEDGPKLVESARRLLEFEPLSIDALRLLSAGYKLTKQPDRAVEVAKRLVGQATAVALDRFTTGADSASLTGTATGRAAETAAGQPVPPAAMELVFEFIDATGIVVASEAIVVPALERDEKASIVAHGYGKGIVGWRYRRKAVEPVPAE